jgi:hypothetical protein
MRATLIAGRALTVAGVTAGCTSGGHASLPAVSEANVSRSAGPAATSSSPPPSTTVQNLLVTARVRAQLIAAGAAAHHLTPADYVDLAPGLTYYAYDKATATYWAGARMYPSDKSLAAQVATQDDGAYLLFRRQASGPWQEWDVGLAGIGGTTCAVEVPAGVLAVWGWPAHSCRPTDDF